MVQVASAPPHPGDYLPPALADTNDSYEEEQDSEAGGDDPGQRAVRGHFIVILRLAVRKSY